MLNYEYYNPDSSNTSEKKYNYALHEPETPPFNKAVDQELALNIL